VGDALYRRQAKTGTRLSEPARPGPGSRTDGLAPISYAARSLAAQPVHWLSLGAVAIAAVVADQLTKHVVANEVALDDEVKVLGPFTIHHVQNSGIAFGLFASATAAVIVLTLVAVAWMVGYFARSGARHPLLPVAVGLLIGGSVSNLADRVRLGHVTDFLDFKYWPAFNLADSFIVIGVAVLLGALGAADRPPRRPGPRRRRVSNAAARP
jgi:signal peptidase II